MIDVSRVNPTDRRARARKPKPDDVFKVGANKGDSSTQTAQTTGESSPGFSDQQTWFGDYNVKGTLLNTIPKAGNRSVVPRPHNQPPRPAHNLP